MKKLSILILLLLTPLLVLGCTADTPNAPVAEAADPVIVERPTVSAANKINPALPPEYCPVTQPPQERFVPPAPFKEEPYPGKFFYGTEALWTAIPTNQTWYALPYNEGVGYGQKLFFQRVGFDWMEEPLPILTVSGRKIDPKSVEEQTLTASDATNGYTPQDGSFMLVGADIPSTGCWEISGRYGEDELTYTIWISN
jgi:hypothetical protein